MHGGGGVLRCAIGLGLVSNLSHDCPAGKNGTVTHAPPPPGDAPSGKTRQPVDPGRAAIIAAVIGAAGLIGGVVIGLKAAPSNGPQPRPTATVTATVTRTAAPGPALQQAAPEEVGWCNTFSGTGAIPKDHELLIFDAPTGPGGAALSPSYYYLDGTARQISSNSWQIKPVFIGPKNKKGFTAEVVSVLVTTSTFAFFGDAADRAAGLASPRPG